MDWARAASFAEVYEELNVPCMFVPFTGALLDAVEVDRATRLLDVASGTGVVARTAIARAPGLRVTAVDLNPAMLAAAERVAPDPRVERVQADVADLPFADASFDAATCQQGLQFFPDPAAALAEVRRVLRPGARVAIAVWSDLAEQPAHAAIVEVAAALVGPALAGPAAAPYVFGDAPRLAGLVEGAGFAEVRVERVEREIHFPSPAELARAYLEGTPVALALAALDDETRREVRAAAVRALERFDSGGGEAVFPMRTYVASAVAP